MAQPRHADIFITEMSSVLPLGYSVEIEGEVLWLLKPGGSMAGSSSHWLASDALLDSQVKCHTTRLTCYLAPFLEADDGSRTRDLRLGKPTLYQLSYVRVGPEF